MNFPLSFKQDMMFEMQKNFSAATCAISIFKGTPPTDARTFLISPSSWDSNLLITFTSLTVNYVALPPSWKLSAIKTQNATGTGTASWAVVYPRGTGNFAFGVVLTGVSLATGDEPVYLSSLSLVNGSSVTLQDFGITAV